jgi:hypothetical protein
MSRPISNMTKTWTSSAEASRGFWILAAPLSIATVLLLTMGVMLRGGAWVALAWVVASMSGFWVLNRFLHGISGTPGETERDGVIWLIPLATAFIPCIALIRMRTPLAQAGALMAWSVLPTALIMVLRPEINHDTFDARHLEPVGFLSSVRSLFKYRLRVAARKTGGSTGPQPMNAPRPRFSVSCMIYYAGFAITGGALIAVRPLLDQMTPEQAQRVFPVWMTVVGAGIFALIAAFVAGLALTYREDRLGWRIQEGERQILAGVYFISTVNVIVTLILAVVLPLLLKYLDG